SSLRRHHGSNHAARRGLAFLSDGTPFGTSRQDVAAVGREVFYLASLCDGRGNAAGRHSVGGGTAVGQRPGNVSQTTRSHRPGSDYPVSSSRPRISSFDPLLPHHGQRIPPCHLRYSYRHVSSSRQAAPWPAPGGAGLYGHSTDRCPRATRISRRSTKETQSDRPIHF